MNKVHRYLVKVRHITLYEDLSVIRLLQIYVKSLELDKGVGNYEDRK